MARIRPLTPPVHPARALLAATLAALALPLAAQAPESAPTAAATRPDPARLDAERMPRVDRSLLLDAFSAGGTTVAVGERGHVLVSTDGSHWEQAERVPTRSTLTTVTSAGGQWWAAGHDGVILHSADGGRTWAAQRVAPWSADQVDPAQGVPLLDLHFEDGQRGVAIGAYSLRLQTEDGGATWSEMPLDIDATVAAEVEEAGPDALAAEDADLAAAGDAPRPDSWLLDSDDLLLEDDADPHLNAILHAADGRQLVVGERGSVLRSGDGGATWQRLELPYAGSMFGVIGWGDGHVLVFGMRGRAFESHDFGDSWTEVSTGVGASLLGGAALPGGGAVLVGTQGSVVLRSDAAAPFRAETFLTANGETPALAAVVAQPDALLLFGEHGAARHVPAAGAAAR